MLWRIKFVAADEPIERAECLAWTDGMLSYVWFGTNQLAAPRSGAYRPARPEMKHAGWELKALSLKV